MKNKISIGFFVSLVILMMTSVLSINAQEEQVVTVSFIPNPTQDLLETTWGTENWVCAEGNFVNFYDEVRVIDNCRVFDSDPTEISFDLQWLVSDLGIYEHPTLGSFEVRYHEAYYPEESEIGGYMITPRYFIFSQPELVSWELDSVRDDGVISFRISRAPRTLVLGIEEDPDTNLRPPYTPGGTFVSVSNQGGWHDSYRPGMMVSQLCELVSESELPEGYSCDSDKVISAETLAAFCTTTDSQICSGNSLNDPGASGLHGGSLISVQGHHPEAVLTASFKVIPSGSPYGESALELESVSFDEGLFQITHPWLNRAENPEFEYLVVLVSYGYGPNMPVTALRTTVAGTTVAFDLIQDYEIVDSREVNRPGDYALWLTNRYGYRTSYPTEPTREHSIAYIFNLDGNLIATIDPNQSE